MLACWSPIVMDALRTAGSTLAATWYVRVPLPCPLLAEVIVIQAAWLAAVQEHSRATLMVIEPSPPGTPKLDDELVTEI
jgi:hypothetical protein